MENNRKVKIMIIGGHLTPALAVLSELEKQGYAGIEKEISTS